MDNIQVENAIQAAIEAVRPAAEAKQLTLNAEIMDVGEMIGDPDRFQQITWNLLSNAIKFTSNGGRVSLYAHREGGNMVVRVTDSGEGIAPAFLPHVFETFQQADGSTTRRNGGLGLGLAIVKRLVQAHGGTVTAESEGLNRGATFTVRLPVREIQGGSHTHDRPKSAQPVERRLDGLRVLVVDDEEDVQILLTEVLERLGATVTVASSAAEALERLSAAPPHVLVSDLAMPKADGYSLVQQLRMLGPDKGGRTPAIALSACARREDAGRALNAGFQLHISKPVDVDCLVRAIANLGSVSSAGGTAR